MKGHSQKLLARLNPFTLEYISIVNESFIHSFVDDEANRMMEKNTLHITVQNNSCEISSVQEFYPNNHMVVKHDDDDN
ncbi:hypothetical protein DERF_004864 [Dermatophagoides farinae]|uniref:Uncharacterized protein n=1 Tax=Dermatophagoides farinae TaxID=6954 RepID=A0A922I378_DERFA|nr:hypothetical protein DERF_004864 [Dermatophagoides farinae]